MFVSGKITLSVVLAAVMLTLGGCRQEQATTTELKLDTPQNTMHTLLTAAANREEAVFTQCFAAAEGEARLLRAIYQHFVAKWDFEEAMHKTFGEDALQGDQWRAMPRPASVDEMVFTAVDENTVQVAMPAMQEMEKLSLVRIDGSWYVNTKELFGELEAGIVAELLESMTRIIRDVTGDAGAQGATFTGVVERLNQRMADQLIPDIEI